MLLHKGNQEGPARRRLVRAHINQRLYPLSLLGKLPMLLVTASLFWWGG